MKIKLNMHKRGFSSDNNTQNDKANRAIAAIALST